MSKRKEYDMFETLHFVILFREKNVLFMTNIHLWDGNQDHCDPIYKTPRDLRIVEWKLFDLEKLIIGLHTSKKPIEVDKCAQCNKQCT